MIPTQILIFRDGQEIGPYSPEEISQRVQNGTLCQDDLAWHEGCPDWMPVSQLIGIPRSPGPASPIARRGFKIIEAVCSDSIGFAMLAIPLVAAFLIWGFSAAGTVQQTVFSVLAVIATAILGGIEAKKLGMGSNVDLTAKGKRRSGPIAWTAAILVLWIFGYPAYLFTRSRYGRRSLLIPALVIVLALMASPFLSAPQLPAVDAPEVVELAESAVRQSPAVAGNSGLADSIRITHPGEVSYDSGKQKRMARAELRSDLGTETVYYSVEWQNRRKRLIWVQFRNSP